MSQNSDTCEMIKVLNVAGDIKTAKTIARYLSGGSLSERQGLSLKNKIYEFEAQVEGEHSKMIMTSVSGHILNYKFTKGYDKWSDDMDDLLPLFNVPVVKVCKINCTRIKDTLEKEVRNCEALIIWTNCDREGENIGYEIIEVCKAVNPTVQVYRARFSVLTENSVRRALDDLGKPDKAISDAVDVRCEIDLRTGFAFSRFQTSRLRKSCPKICQGRTFSYGGCQFPALGFIVERHRAIEDFHPKVFETIRIMDVRDGISVEFRWETICLVEGLPCQKILNKCLESRDATVEEIRHNCESKERPLPLNTVELIKHCLDEFHFTAQRTITIAMNLYDQGLISYPRTEMNTFPHDLDLLSLVKPQCANPKWGQFAAQILKDGPLPRQGMKEGGAHSPIHPTENIAALYGDEMKVYDFIVRCFLACVSKDAQVEETIVTLNIAEEKFEASGIRITVENYLLVYPFKSWHERDIPDYKAGQTFRPTCIELVDGKAPSPELMTESELITILAKNHIGTDSTYADHIEKIRSRGYVYSSDKFWKPTKLGLAILEGYSKMKVNIGKPDERASLENDLQLICNGERIPANVLEDHLLRYRNIIKRILEPTHLEMFDRTIQIWLCEGPNFACPSPAKFPRLSQGKSTD